MFACFYACVCVCLGSMHVCVNEQKKAERLSLSFYVYSTVRTHKHVLMAGNRAQAPYVHHSPLFLFTISLVLVPLGVHVLLLLPLLSRTVSWSLSSFLSTQFKSSAYAQYVTPFSHIRSHGPMCTFELKSNGTTINNHVWNYMLRYTFWWRCMK